MSIIEDINTAILSTINSLSFRCIQVELVGGKKKTLKLIIEKSNFEPASARDCEVVSKTVSTILDVEEIIQDDYILEVSSAGLERPLFDMNDYMRFINKPISIQLKEPVDNKQKFKAVIVGVENDMIIVQEMQNSSKNSNKKKHIISSKIQHNLLAETPRIMLNLSQIKKANTLFTDDMLKQALKQKK